MPFRIVRNDITKMDTEFIVNAANAKTAVGSGCDKAVYSAAGYEELFDYRKNNIGEVKEGEVFLTPSFNLKIKGIIHAVSPQYIDGKHGEDRKLRSCYRKSLLLAAKEGAKSIAFPLLSTGSFGYPKEEGMRIAVDEINAFLLTHEMDIVLVVFDTRSTELGEHIFPDLKAYIDHHYVLDKREEEYGDAFFASVRSVDAEYDAYVTRRDDLERRLFRNTLGSKSIADSCPMPAAAKPCEDNIEILESKLKERIKHREDSFSKYLLYLIESKGLKNSQVYKAALVDKKTFSKIKNNKNYHPDKITVLCLCVGAKLNLDETKDLLARAGYALSPCNLTDIVFSFFIEQEHYDILDIDIELEALGEKCIIK